MEVSGWPEAVSAQVAATAVGVSRQYLTGKAVAGGCPRNGDGTFDVRAVVAWWIERARKEGYKEGEAAAAPVSESPALERQREAAAVLKQLEVAQALSMLVPRSVVSAQWTRAVTAFSQILQGFPSTLAQRVYALLEAERGAQAIADLLTAAVDDAMRQMQERFSKGLGEDDEAADGAGVPAEVTHDDAG